MTSDILSTIRNLVARSSAPNTVSLAYSNFGTRLQNSEQLIDISGRPNLKVVPFFLRCPHFKKARYLLEDVLGMFATILKGDM